ncbi:MAG: FAD-dependent oxidoreductase [Halobacteria archaeon]|nr:FAD-dependent oxidoreductase [Halobacteria archaeon]
MVLTCSGAELDLWEQCQRLITDGRSSWIFTLPANRGRKTISETTHPALAVQLVLLAMGYAHPVHDGLLSQLDLGFDERGNAAATDDDYQASVPGVFACGDVRRGQSLVVWAIREGRQCARAVDTWLSGTSDLPRM